MARSIKGCMNCGETRETAGHRLCFRCYRQEERKLADDLWAKPDTNAKELAKTQRKTRKALMKMMDALEEIETGKLVPEATVEAWRTLLRPEVARIALSLSEARMSSESDESSEQVNSEHDNVSEQFTQPADGPRADVITALVSQGFARKDAVSAMEFAEGQDFNSLFRAALMHLTGSKPAPEPPLPREPSEPDNVSEPVNSEHDSASEQFTQPSLKDAGDLNTEPINPGSEPVNSEQESLSEQFTQPTELLEETILGDQFSTDSAGTRQPSVLPPAVQQRVTKLKKEKGKAHAA